MIEQYIPTKHPHITGEEDSESMGYILKDSFQHAYTVIETKGNKIYIRGTMDGDTSIRSMKRRGYFCYYISYNKSTDITILGFEKID